MTTALASRRSQRRAWRLTAVAMVPIVAIELVAYALGASGLVLALLPLACSDIIAVAAGWRGRRRNNQAKGTKE